MVESTRMPYSSLADTYCEEPLLGIGNVNITKDNMIEDYMPR